MAYLLNELLIDIEKMSCDADLEEPFISNTRTLKRKLEDFFTGKIVFETLNNRLLVYSLDINPCFYVKRLWRDLVFVTRTLQKRLQE